MNEEEKKAIENLKLFLDKDKNEDNYLTDENLRTILNLVEKQSKMIEIMAEHLTTPTHNKEWVIKYFEGEVELEENA